MYRNMAGSLIEHGAVVTTEPKAKEVRRFVEKLITLAKRGTLQARRQAIAMVGDREIVEVEDGIPLPAMKKTERVTVVTKLFDEIAPRFADRPGGYTRIIRMGETRIGDSGEKVMLQLLSGQAEGEGEGQGRKRSKRRARAQKRYAMAGSRGPKAAGEQAQAPAEGPQDQAEEPEQPAQEAAPEDQDQEQPEAQGDTQAQGAPENTEEETDQ
jgi:large subunit ribosomal protein L17